MAVHWEVGRVKSVAVSVGVDFPASPQSPSRLRILTADFTWVVFGINEVTGGVVTVGRRPLLSGSDLVGVPKIKAAEVAREGDDALSLLLLLEDSSVVFVWEGLGTDDGVEGEDAVPSGSLLARLTVSDPLLSVCRNMTGDTVFVILNDM